MKIRIFKICLLVLFLSVFFISDNAFSDDTDNCLDGALFITDTLYIPKLAVEGTDQLYNVCLQIKQQQNEFFLELTNFKILVCQETSALTATLATDGKLHIPYLDIEGSTFWTVDLQLVASSSLLPVWFRIDHYENLDNTLGFARLNHSLSRKIDYWKCVDPDYAKHYCPNK